jgi:predicted PhzF superfamily epimerase YddE/YHI9
LSGGQRFSQIDAFTDRPFSGNPAAVCLAVTVLRGELLH